MADVKRNGGSSGQNGQQTNGQQTNGYRRIERSGKDSKDTYSAPLGKPSKQKKKTFMGNVKAMRAASRRPLPTEMGDGSYRAVSNRPGMRQDLSVIGKNGKFNIRDTIFILE